MRAPVRTALAGLLAAFAAFAALPAGAAPSPEADLAKARNAYQYGSYQLVIDTLAPLLYPSVQLAALDHEIEARRLLGLALLWQKDDAGAEREFYALLTRRPDYSLDPLIDPPAFIEFFDRIKTSIRERLDEIRRQQVEAARAKEREAESQRRRIAELEKKLSEEQATAYVVAEQQKSRLVAFLPLGLGQYQNGHLRKGYAFMISELALGAASVTLALAVKIKWPDGVFPKDERDEADAFVSAQVVTGVAFLVAAAWGIVDANVYFAPRTTSPPRRVPRESLTPGLGGAGRPPIGGESAHP